MLNKQAKLIFVSVIGTFLEWTEYCLYGYLAAKISVLFFPQFDARVGLLATFGIFAAGYFARPLGGILFGHIGDTRGRKQALMVSMALMGVATVSIGLLPTYAEWGLFAPLLLLLCRILQGLAVSGEFNGAAIFLIEHAQPGYKNRAGSWVGAAAAAGMVFGALLVSMVSYDGLPTWVWRIPFLIGALSCFVGWYLRSTIAESPEFLAYQVTGQSTQHVPLFAAFKESKWVMLQTAAVAAFIGINVYICNIYFATFLIHSAAFSVHTALMIVAFGQGCVALLIPLMGMLADASSGRLLLLVGLLGAALAAPLVFMLGMMQSVQMALVAQLIYAVFNAMTSAPVFNYINTLFPARHRYTGITFSWSLSVAVFAGTAPLIAQYLVGTLEWLQGPALYVSLSAIIAGIAVLTLPSREATMASGLGLK